MSKAFHIFLICVAMLSCSALHNEKPQKFNGVNLVSTRQIQDSSYCTPLKDNHINSVAIVPFAYGNSGSGELILETTWQWWGESFEGSKELARIAKNQGLHVMIKPQVWFDWGTYTGDVDLGSEEKWSLFEHSYSEYILKHAKNAQEVGADILCIGTELKTFVLKRPLYWDSLITEVKAVYSGKLTYAGNWDSYKTMPFWEQLDFIGVDAYFPVSEEKTPLAKTIENSWKGHSLELKTISEQYDRQILFCEYGYRSTNHCAAQPWDSSREGEPNLEAQCQAYEGFFSSVWKEPFLAGGFLWKWYPNNERAGGPSDNRFTPQNKPALEVIKRNYAISG